MNKLASARGRVAFFTAIEVLEEVADGVWDAKHPSQSSITATVNKWLSDNPDFSLLDTPRYEVRLISQREQQGKKIREFSVTVSCIYRHRLEEDKDERDQSEVKEDSISDRKSVV